MVYSYCSYQLDRVCSFYSENDGNFTFYSCLSENGVKRTMTKNIRTIRDVAHITIIQNKIQKTSLPVANKRFSSFLIVSNFRLHLFFQLREYFNIVYS